MPQALTQYLKELEGFRERALSMHHALKINPGSLKSFMDMEKEDSKR